MLIDRCRTVGDGGADGMREAAAVVPMTTWSHWTSVAQPGHRRLTGVAWKQAVHPALFSAVYCSRLASVPWRHHLRRAIAACTVPR